MATELNTMPADGRSRKKSGMTTPQIRVLQILKAAKEGGGLSRGEISRRGGYDTPVCLSRAIGYSDPDKRRAFEQTKDGGGEPGKPFPSLITLGFVYESEIDVEGLKETIVSLTPAGVAAYEDLKAKGLLVPMSSKE